jgi:hypothetical protein
MEYLGCYDSYGEGMRHFFSIPLDTPYPSLLNTPVHTLFVYTSSGTNTGSKCRQTLCILPCFGVIAYIRNQPVRRSTGEVFQGDVSLNNNTDITAKELQLNIVKSDYFMAAKGLLRFLNKSDRLFQQMNALYFGGNLSTERMRQYFPDYTPNDPAYTDFKKKMGCDLFLRNILMHRASIDAVVREEEAAPSIPPIESLSDVNLFVRRNTFFGIDLADPALRMNQTHFPMLARYMETSEDGVESLLRTFLNRDPTKYNGLLNAPYIKTVHDRVYTEAIHSADDTPLS